MNIQIVLSLENFSTMTRSLRRSRRGSAKKNSDYNVGDIVEVSWSFGVGRPYLPSFALIVKNFEVVDCCFVVGSPKLLLAMC